MVWYHYVAYAFGGLFLSNSVPHFVAGVMGRPFQSPFAKPPGEGLSSSRTNVLWGGLNLAIGYLLIFQVGTFDLRAWDQVLAVAIPGFAIALFAANHFGRFNGGNPPQA